MDGAAATASRGCAAFPDLNENPSMRIEAAPTEKRYEKPEGERRGLIIVNTGDGKGKSTAALAWPCAPMAVARPSRSTSS